MASGFQGTINSLANYARTIAAGRVQYDEIYKENCHRVYSLAFWMTGNELTAEQLSANTFLRAFASAAEPTTDNLDRAFLTEVRELTPIGVLTLSCTASADSKSIYGNIKRIHLEQAVKTANEQSRAHQGYQRQRDFRDYQHVANGLAAAEAR